MSETAEEQSTAEPLQEQGGDPACWLDRVCEVCGAVADVPGELVCPHPGRPAAPRPPE